MGYGAAWGGGWGFGAVMSFEMAATSYHSHFSLACTIQNVKGRKAKDRWSKPFAALVLFQMFFASLDSTVYVL